MARSVDSGTHTSADRARLCRARRSLYCAGFRARSMPQIGRAQE